MQGCQDTGEMKRKSTPKILKGCKKFVNGKPHILHNQIIKIDVKENDKVPLFHSDHTFNIL